MNLLSAVTQMRHWLADFGGYAYDDATWQSDDADALWKNDELTDYLDQATTHYCLLNPIHDHTTAGFTRMSLVAATAEYALDPRVLYVSEIKLSGESKPLTRLDITDMKELNLDWEAETGDVTGYLLDLDARQVRFYKIPTASATAILRVDRLHATALSWASNGDDFEIPLHSQYPLLYYAMHLAYMKDDDETQNRNLSATWHEKWELAGGHTVSSHSVRVRSEAYDRPHRTRSYY